MKMESSESPESLVNRILNSDPGIISCYLMRDPEGAVIAETRKQGLESRFGSFARAGSGMAPIWGLVALNAFRRMDSERSKMKYVMIARELFDVLLFPNPWDDRIVIGIMLTKNLEPSRIYEMIVTLIRERK